jgi:hypothetical protein
MSIDTMTRTFQVNDEVTVVGDRGRFPGVYVITKVPVGARGVNYTAKPKNDPTGRGLRAEGQFFTAHIPGAEPVRAVLRPYVPAPSTGAVITISGIRKIDPTTLYVVLGEGRGRDNGVRAARLGGDGGRYYTSIPVANVTVVDPTTLVRV